MQTGGLKAAYVEERIDGPASWTIERDDHALILHEAGSYQRLETWLDGRRTSLGSPLSGEIWFAAAGQQYRGAAQGGAVGYIAVDIPSDRLTVGPGAGALAGYRDRGMAALVRALLAGDIDAAGALVAALADLLERRGPSRPVPPAMTRRIDALRAAIEDRLDTHLTIEDMAVEAGMSVNSLIVHFARATGRTPAQYVLHQRLRRACRYLDSLPVSVTEIALATGFSSHAHLCSAFRAKLGMSPGEWRRRGDSVLMTTRGA